jgi:hypothetical protein
VRLLGGPRRPRTGRITPATLVAAIVVTSTVARCAAAWTLPGPWIVPDEPLYALLGRSLWQTGQLDVLGRGAGYYSLVYPAFVGPFLTWGDLAVGYRALQAAQALAMSSTAVPVYLWGRRLMRPGWAVAAAALTVSVPALAYSGTVMTEVLFLPLVVLAAWACARMLERPTPVRQLVLGLALLAAVGTRLQALALIPAVLTAVGLKALLERDARVLRRTLPVGVGVVAIAAAAAANGSSALGGYAVAAHGGYSPTGVAEALVQHAAGVLLLCGVLPACAVALLGWEALRGRESSPVLRAYLATTVAFAVWTVAQVGVFASRWVDGIAERNLLPLAPLLFLGLCAWLDRGAPRSYVAAATVAFACAAAIVTVPYDRFVELAKIQNSPTFAAVLSLRAAHPSLDPSLVLALPGVVLAAAAALAPRRALVVAVPLLAAAFAVASATAQGEYRALARTTQAKDVGSNPRFVDDAADGPVAVIFRGGSTFPTVWLTAFWNRRVARVYDLPDGYVAGPMPQATVDAGGDGILRLSGRPIEERLVVLPAPATGDGTRLATSTFTGAEDASTSLWRLSDPPRLLEYRIGFTPNGDIPYRAEVHEFRCDDGGTFLVTLLGKGDPQQVRFLLDGDHVRTVALSDDEAPTTLVHVPPGRAECTLGLVPETLVGTTQVRFGRS